MDENTKKVKKVGMKDIQREGWEYELTVSLNLDRDTHMATASKDRTGLFDKADPFVITAETGQKIKQWCEQGTAPVSTKPELLPTNEYFEAMKKALKSKERTIPMLEEKWFISEETKALLLA